MLITLSAALGYLVGSVAATNILLTNDDGWAVAQIRAQYSAINSAGYSVRTTLFRLGALGAIFIADVETFS